MMPDVSRGPLERQLRQYRLGHRRRRRARLYRLHWLKPGSVWAVDLAEPPEPVNGGDRMVLAVRDLASRYTIAWLALPRGSAREVSRMMATLFRRIGVPIVLKSDNGSCFVAPAFRLLLARFGVVHLRSPRAWPQYNGACEAGIGVLKALTDTAAAGRGDPDQWTSDDLEEACGRANDLARKIGAKLITAREEWMTRRRGRATHRRILRDLVADHFAELLKAVPNKSKHRARIRRKAIQQALIQMDLLKVTSHWIRVRSTGRGSTLSYR
jgi:transposase InsO family protein